MKHPSTELDESFTDLVVQHHVQLRAFVRALGVDPDWVDDIAQDVFLTALRERDSFDGTRDLGKWLRGIARNLVRNEVRKQGRRKRLLHEGLSELLIESSEQEQDVPLWQETRMPAMRDCVEALPNRSSQIVAESYGGGWKSSEVADHVNMTAAAVRQASC